MSAPLQHQKDHKTLFSHIGTGGIKDRDNYRATLWSDIWHVEIAPSPGYWGFVSALSFWCYTPLAKGLVALDRFCLYASSPWYGDFRTGPFVVGPVYLSRARGWVARARARAGQGQGSSPCAL